MSETTVGPSESAEPTAAGVSESETATELEREAAELSIRSLLDAGAHFGHQTPRWNPRMRSYIFGERNGTHILDLDQTLPLFREALDYIQERASEGGKVLFVGTKRQAAASIQAEAIRSEQFYVNNRWLGGMLTNWKTVKRSIDRYKSIIETVEDEEKSEGLSKKELARLNRLREKYRKSLEGIREMTRLPAVIFVVDVSKEQIAVSDGRRLGIPIVGIVDSNCDPEGIDFVIPGNDDATRAIDFYCRLVGEACIEGARIHNEQIQSETHADPTAAGAAEAPPARRRVVEIKQAPRRSRGAQATSGSGRTHSAGGREDGSVEQPAADAAPGAAAPAESEAV
ncbi:MAG: 30S ribosomal protein S2, partial [Myxococcota bacterium]